MKIQNNVHIINSIEPKIFRRFILDLSIDTQYTFNHFGEINLNTIDSIVKRELTNSLKIKFFTLVNNNLIAYSFLIRFEKTTKKHNCILGIVIADEWQRKGYGKKIMEYMIKYAWKKGLKKIWLNVYPDNIYAFKLYKSLGFEIEGIFMADEINKRKERHIISMALFKNKNFSSKERERIWNDLEQ